MTINHLFPAKIPRALIKAYLATPSLQPCHNCEDCGLHVPTEFIDGKPTNTMFPRCPGCGGRTGLNAFSEKHAGQRIPVFSGGQVSNPPQAAFSIRAAYQRLDLFKILF